VTRNLLNPLSTLYDLLPRINTAKSAKCGRVFTTTDEKQFEKDIAMELNIVIVYYILNIDEQIMQEYLLYTYEEQ